MSAQKFKDLAGPVIDKAIPHSCIVDPLPLMVRYLDGDGLMSNDEREILMFALYLENKNLEGGLVAQAIKKMREIRP